MNNNETKNSIRDQILNRIKAGKLKMKPKVYFVLKNIIFVAAVVALSMLIVYLISFIVFSLDKNGAWLLTRLGLGGLLSLIVSLPWLLILIILLSMFLIELLIKNLKFAYHRPLIYSILGVMVLFLALGFFTHLTPLHKGLSCLCAEHKVPIASFLYDSYKEMDFPDFYRGEILEIDEEEAQLQKLNGEVVRLQITSDSYGSDQEKLQRGDKIMLIGKKKNSVINIANFEKDNDCGCGACNQFPKNLK